MRTCFRIIAVLLFILPGTISFGRTYLKGTSTQDSVFHYLLPEFVEGRVKMKNGKMEYALMNYNKITEELIFDKNGTMLALDSISKVDTVYLGEVVLIPHEKIFMDLLIKGPVSLMVQHKCNVFPAGSPSGYGGTTETGAARDVYAMTSMGKPYKIKLPSDYHVTDADQNWIRKDNEWYKANSFRQIIKIFPEKAEKLNAYLKKVRPDIKKRDELIAFVLQYYK